MILTKDRIVNIYKKFNKIAGFGSDKSSINDTIFNLIKTITEDGYTIKEKEEAFTTYMAIQLYNFYSNKKDYLNNLYHDSMPKEGKIIVNLDEEEDKEVEEVDYSFDQSSILQLADEDYCPNEEQINSLKALVIESADRINSIEEINEDGKVIDAIKKTNFSEKELFVDNKYVSKIDKNEVLTNFRRNEVEEICTNLKKVYDRYHSFVSPLAKLDKYNVDFYNDTKYDRVVSQINLDIKQRNISSLKTYENQRKNELKEELNKNINYYFALEQAIKEKEGTIGRYLNPFNWKRTYQTNKMMKELKQRITNKFNLTSFDWDCFKKSNTNSFKTNKIKEKIKNKNGIVEVNLKDDKVFQEAYDRDIIRARNIVLHMDDVSSPFKVEFDNEVKITNPHELGKLQNQLRDRYNQVLSEDESELTNV